MKSPPTHCSGKSSYHCDQNPAGKKELRRKQKLKQVFAHREFTNGIVICSSDAQAFSTKRLHYTFGPISRKRQPLSNRVFPSRYLTSSPRTYVLHVCPYQNEYQCVSYTAYSFYRSPQIFECSRVSWPSFRIPIRYRADRVKWLWRECYRPMYHPKP